MKNQVKTRLVLTHVVEYYKKSELVKADVVAEVTKEGMRNYWNREVELLKQGDFGCVELENFIAVSKCVRDYDYTISRIIERILIEQD